MNLFKKNLCLKDTKATPTVPYMVVKACSFRDKSLKGKYVEFQIRGKVQ